MVPLRILVGCAALFMYFMNAQAEQPRPIGEPPESLVEQLDLAPFYEKHIDAHGFPIVGSRHVADAALREAAMLVDQMLSQREDVRKAIIENRVRLAVMAHHELTTMIPEHSDLTPARYWDKRARGLGATRQRPAVSCGEENLLGYPGDPYSTENILIHEFAHVIHQMGMNSVDPAFQDRLDAAYDAALAARLWEGTYAGSNSAEYWAEGVQSWFDTNRENDGQHNHVNTRAELVEYDPQLAKLLENVFGDGSWRYQPPKKRAAEENKHLGDYDPSTAPTFQWPAELIE